jgi:flagellar basal-body rod protein FlgG
MQVSQRIAVSGMLANQRQLDVVSNNLANVNATAFKRSVAHTTDVGYQAGLRAPVGPEGAEVDIVGIGEGTQLASLHHDFLPGAVQATGNLLDVALQGEGFFSVTLPNGQTGLTRDGAFTLDGTGRLVTGGGLPVQSTAGTDLMVPTDSVEVRFDDLGQLIATAADGTEQIVGQMSLSLIPNPRGLLADGQNLWVATEASGAPVQIAADAPNAPLLVAGALEGSNVNVGDEFTRMITAQRGYQLNAKVVQAWDEVARMANSLRGA